MHQFTTQPPYQSPCAATAWDGLATSQGRRHTNSPYIQALFCTRGAGLHQPTPGVMHQLAAHCSSGHHRPWQARLRVLRPGTSGHAPWSCMALWQHSGVGRRACWTWHAAMPARQMTQRCQTPGSAALVAAAFAGKRWHCRSQVVFQVASASAWTA